jgi:hypothetical protein
VLLNALVAGAAFAMNLQTGSAPCGFGAVELIRLPMKTVSLRRTCFIFVVLSLVVAACERPVVYGQKGRPPTDDEIVDQVRIKLASDIVQGGALTVDCKNGVVTLTGPVETEKQKARAE